MWDQCQVTAGPSKNLHINQTSRDVYASVIQFPQKQFGDSGHDRQISVLQQNFRKNRGNSDTLDESQHLSGKSRGYYVVFYADREIYLNL